MTQDHSALLAQLDAPEVRRCRGGVRRADPRRVAGANRGRSNRDDRRGRYQRIEPIEARTSTGTDPKRCPPPSGHIEVQIPKLRAGSFFPSLLERRRRIDKALHADLVAAMGVDSGVSKSEVSRICAGLDKEIDAFRTRSLTHTQFPYVFCDATFLQSQGGCIDRMLAGVVMRERGVSALYRGHQSPAAVNGR